jgi:hypothetical protein
LSIFDGYKKISLVKHLFGYSTHIIFIEGFTIVLTTIAEDCGLGGKDIPIGCVEVEFEYGFWIGAGVN